MAIGRYLRSGVHVEDPPVARLLFANTRVAWFWPVVRLYVGYGWLEAGLHKSPTPGGWSTALLSAKKGSRRSMLELVGRVPERLDELRTVLNVVDPARAEERQAAWELAARGEATESLTVLPLPGGPRLVHVRNAPVRGAAGAVSSVLVAGGARAGGLSGGATAPGLPAPRRTTRLCRLSAGSGR